MYLAITKVNPLPEYKLRLVFENNEEKIFDVKPYLSLGIFKEITDPNVFNSVHISFDSIEWSNGADLDPEVLYSESISIE
jgi:hypothetical protein